MDKKIRLFHVDDDIRDLNFTKKVIESVEEIEYLGNSREPKNCIDHINRIVPDLLLLDVEMPVMNGMEVAAQIENPAIKIVFLTSHTDYALSAFDCCALHYLIKPVKREDFVELLRRIKTQNEFLAGSKEQLQEMKEFTKNKEHFPERLFINTQKEVFVIQLEKIAYIEANGAYTIFRMVDGTSVVSSKALKVYTEIIEKNPDFFRIHRSYIINKKRISSIQKGKTTVKFLFENGLNFEIGKLNKDSWYNDLFA